MSNKLSERIQFGLLLITVAIVLWVIFESHNLRPIADDYCFGAMSGEFGLFGGVVLMWNVWSGFVSQNFITFLLVGMPLAFLPFDIASAICFIFTAFGMGAVVLAVNRSIQLPLKLGWGWLVFIAFMWWTFLWATFALGIQNTNLSTANDYNLLSIVSALTFWQNVNSAYVVPLQIIFIALAIGWSFSNQKRYPYSSFLIPLVIGVFSGGVAPVQMVSLLLVACMIAACIFFMPRTRDWNRNFWIILSVAILVSGLICGLFSPGNAVRSAILKPNFEFTVERVALLLKVTSKQGVGNWLRGYFNIGSLIILILAIGYSFFTLTRNNQERAIKILIVAASFSLFALVLSLATRLSQEFSGIAYWHHTSSLVCVFISIIFFGIWIGIIIKGVNNLFVSGSMYVFFIFALIIGIKANMKMVESIELRHAAWVKGPASINGVVDTDNPEEFQMGCWRKLNSQRSHPITRSP